MTIFSRQPDGQRLETPPSETHVGREPQRGLLKITLLAVVMLAVLALAVYGHVVYWYLPRVRPAKPAPTSRVAALLGDSSFPAVLWLPYPHQNLGVLDPASSDRQGYLAAFARLTGLPPPVLPSFGGFTVVPSTELALAAGADGERFVVMAQVYPALAMFSRLAGRLADNPWLAGGPVTVQGRAAEVVWEGNLWTVRAGSASNGGAPQVSVSAGAALPVSEAVLPVPEAGSEALGLLMLHRPSAPFAADLYRLGTDVDALEVRSRSDIAASLWSRAESLADPELVLLLAAGPGSDLGVQSLAFFLRDADSSELPRAAVLVRADRVPDSPWQLPGASLARMVGGVEEETVGGWLIQALGGHSLAAARALEPQVDAVAGRALMASAGGAAPTTGYLAWGLWADLGNTHAEVDRLARIAERVPLVPRREAQRWRDAETVLRPVADRFSRLTIVVVDDPPALRLRLVRHRPAVD